MSDEHGDLVDRATRCEAPAIDTLLERHLPGLRAFIRLRSDPAVRDRESSSDLAQSVCREVLADLSAFEYRGEAAFKSWLYTAALSKIRDRARYHRAQKRDVGREQAGELDAYYAQFATPSREVVAREEAARIEAAFDELPEHYREVLTLTRVAGLTHAEAAERMGRSEGSVHGLVDRALMRLSWILSRGEDD